MYELIAISPQDGWAIFTDGTDVFVIRPPYTPAHKIALKQSEVNRIIKEGGFAKPTNGESIFSSISDLVLYLEQKIITSREESGAPLPNKGLGESLLSFATINQLHKFLERIEGELISNGRTADAYRALMACLKLPQVTEARDIHEKVLNLLDRVSPAKRMSLVQNAIDIKFRFPLSVAKYGAEKLRDFDAVICRRRSLFPFGAQG